MNKIQFWQMETELKSTQKALEYKELGNKEFKI